MQSCTLRVSDVSDTFQSDFSNLLNKHVHTLLIWYSCSFQRGIHVWTYFLIVLHNQVATTVSCIKRLTLMIMLFYLHTGLYDLIFTYILMVRMSHLVRFGHACSVSINFDLRHNVLTSSHTC